MTRATDDRSVCTRAEDTLLSTREALNRRQGYSRT